VHGDVGKGGDDLLLWREIRALLEFKIANGSRKCEVAIDSAKIDESACGTYPGFFTC